ncbi:type I Iterative Polyketide synthase (PKS), partial [Aspergillus brasiliensis]
MTAVSAADHPISDRPPSVSASPTHHPHSQDDLSILDQDASMPIAIVGMGFRGPGDAPDIARLWTMMVEGREAWSEIPASRWNHSAFFHPDHARHGTINVHGGHFLAEDVSLFDAPFFNMTGDEVAAMDPQQRLLLEVTYEGLENAGISLSKVAGSQTSCFVGCFNADYTDLLLRDPESIPMYQCTNAGQSRAMTANRISYFFDLKGPSVTVDTACSGSLVALHLACQSLRTGETSMAIAAGVNVILCHEFMSTMTMMKFLSPNGRCRTFDKDADGYARGEAIGCLVLKPLKDAVRDGDHLYAVIRGSGSNQDGRTAGITLPNGSAQESLTRSSSRHTAHGTGTQAGDPIEAEALARVFGPGRTASRPLRIGSIKTNVGHLEGTSGVAGIIKAVLMLENRMFLPNRNFDNINPRILLDEWKLKVQLECQPWDTPGPHRVSVNSFGYGGSNAHVILEDAWGYMSDRGLMELAGRSMSRGAGDDDKGPEPRLARVYMLSAFSEGSLKEYGRHLREYLLGKGPKATDDFMNNFAYTLNERRTAHLYRVAILGTTATEVSEALERVTARIYQASRRPNIGFVFTGQGAQWYGMGKGLMALYPIFRQSVHRLDAYMATVQAPFRIADLLSAWGIQPDSVTGHSSGEIAAAYAAGALTMGDAISVAYYRGVAVSDLCEHDKRRKGAMLALGMPAENAQSYIDQLETGKAFVACINSPTSVTISGDVPAIEELEEAVRHKEVFSRRLAVEVAYHSHHMES